MIPGRRLVIDQRILHQDHNGTAAGDDSIRAASTCDAKSSTSPSLFLEFGLFALAASRLFRAIRERAAVSPRMTSRCSGGVPLPSNLGGTGVVLGGRAVLVCASNGQLSALVPYDVPVNTQQQLLV
jgi:hypothetical protein